MGNPIMIAPSILSADLGNLADDLRAIANADYIHIDVMDGHFTGNLTFGPEVVRVAKRVSDVPLDVHMMVSNPEDTVPWYIDAGADMITVHYEAATHLHRVVTTIKAAGIKAGVVLNPATPVSSLESIIGDVDAVLIMSVDPGFGGQSYILSTDAKLVALRELCIRAGVDPIIEVDGGISSKNIERVARCGATMFVAGSAVYGADDRAAAIEELRGLARRATASEE